VSFLCISYVGHATKIAVVLWGTSMSRSKVSDIPEAGSLGASSQGRKPSLSNGNGGARAKDGRPYRAADESFYRALIENSFDLMFLFGADGAIEFASPSCTHILGYTPEELIGRGYLDLVHPDDSAAALEGFAILVKEGGSGQNMELRIRAKDGSWHWIEGLGTNLMENPAVGALVVNARDVTDRKRADLERAQAEDILRQEQQENEIIFHSAPYMVWYKDASNRILRANRSAAQSVGLDVKEVEGRSLYDLFPSEAVRYHQDDLEVIRTGQPKLGITEPFRLPSGEVRVVRTHKVPYRDPDGKIIGVVAFMTDITERQRAEEAMRRSEVNYRSLVQNAPYGICRTDEHGQLFNVNPALVEMLGYGSEEALLSVNMDADIFHAVDARAAIIKDRGEIFDGIEVTWHRLDGTIIHVRLSGRPVRDPEWPSTCYELIAENVTEQWALEKQFRQAQKMEAVGRLAGGVAHDFNNLLTVIKGHAELLLDRTKNDEWFQKKAEQIEKAADRAATLTRQLLAFSRMQVLQAKVFDLCEIVADMGKMLPRLIGENIELSIVAKTRSGQVKADPGQMEQVILNLAVNARDAMPDGGKLRIETSDVELDEVFARHHPPLEPGHYVCLTVSDTGTGMAPETQAHIFEPFFTTKEVGKGTGLGLATVYGVIKQSGGYIWVSSEQGRGSTFQVYLPQVQQEPLPVPLPAIREEVPFGTETVLIAEDEKEVREIAREFLCLSGYTVLEARDGAEALKIAAAHAGPIHVLITDMIMPTVGGRELAERISEARPETKIIYMSGYAEYSAEAKNGEEGPGILLTKPFTRMGIVRAVNEILRAYPPN
jgi:two-component system, cell cycle sensor histidine kinase and response regulator CckA